MLNVTLTMITLSALGSMCRLTIRHWGGSGDPRRRIRAEADRNRCQAAAFSQVRRPTHRDGPVVYKTGALPVRRRIEPHFSTPIAGAGRWCPARARCRICIPLAVAAAHPAHDATTTASRGSEHDHGKCAVRVAVGSGDRSCVRAGRTCCGHSPACWTHYPLITMYIR